MIEGILAKFKGVRSKSANAWEACCPAHDDRTASLCIGIGDDGRGLIHCQAGCDTKDVLDAAGLRMQDLFPDDRTSTKRSSSSQKRIVVNYDYRDEAGELLYQALRYEPKDFRQRCPDGKGGWSWKLDGVRRVLYRLPELIAADPAEIVHIVEGEKDVDRLRSLGAVATCNVGGAGRWKAEYGQHLRGRNVVILADNDEVGRKHAAEVAVHLSGHAASLRVLELSGLPTKGDVSDWLNGGGTIAELKLLALAAPEWHPGQDDQGEREAASATADESFPSSIPGIERPEGRTEIANARRLTAAHGHDLHWCETWGKWLVYDGKRFNVDESLSVDAFAKSVSGQLWKDALSAVGRADDKQVAEAMKFAKVSAGAYAIRNMVHLAKSEPGIAISPDELDADPWLFNCANGVIDLKTGELLAHDRSYRFTKISPIDYLRDAACPTWEESVFKIFLGNEALIGFCQRLLGLAMVGQVIEQIMPVFHGVGSNGKTVMTEVALDIFGDYGAKVASDLLLAKMGDAHPTGKADLCGRRLVLASETDDGRRLSESVVKELTGNDRIAARRMREDFWSFEPSHLILLVTNHKPRVRGTDHSIWRRLLLMPFDARFWDPDKGESGPEDFRADKRLKEKLRAEYPGILAWLVRGCLEWQQTGLHVPETVKAATKEYREAEDVLGEFVADCFAFERTGSVKASDFRKRYETWCKMNGEKVLSSRKVGEYLMSQDGVNRRNSNGVWYDGLVEIGD